jgi:hypothetical protein
MNRVCDKLDLDKDLFINSQEYLLSDDENLADFEKTNSEISAFKNKIEMQRN